jgi:sporulation protein YlmC with PRC-barrel domain
MSMGAAEAHIELMLGKRVRDVDGHVVGRLEEFRVEIADDGDYVVTEFHIGPAALLERIAGFVVQLPFFRTLPSVKGPYRVSWTQIDLSDPEQLRLTVRREELQR